MGNKNNAEFAMDELKKEVFFLLGRVSEKRENNNGSRKNMKTVL
jgi:hypothetical protein